MPPASRPSLGLALRPGFPAALLVGAALLAGLAPLARAHTRSLGSADFALEESGRVAIGIEMEHGDVLEIFDVDLARKDEAPLLDKKAAAILTRFVRLEADGRRCPVIYERWEPASANGVRFSLSASCPPAPERLVLDWGLSTLTVLDLQAATTVTAPGGVTHTLVLSRKSSHAELVVAAPSALRTFGSFLVLGTEHILLGWDHLAFLLALLLACARYRRLLLVVSGFTVAHSVTLALGALGLVPVPSAIVEPIIAGSIAVAALIAAMRLYAGTLAHPGSLVEPPSAWPELSLVLGFGLVHGLGFASMLEEALGQSGGGVAVPLVAFNLGVELGQLVAVSLAFPLLVLVGRRGVGRVVFLALLFGLVALGAYVAVERLLG